jgi:hypothetical protein
VREHSKSEHASKPILYQQNSSLTLNSHESGYISGVDAQPYINTSATTAVKSRPV